MEETTINRDSQKRITFLKQFPYDDVLSLLDKPSWNQKPCPDRHKTCKGISIIKIP